MTMSKTMRMKDLAAKAGVSVSTVSRVLSDSAGTNPEIRQRVMDLAHEHGYKRLRRKPVRRQDDTRKALNGRIAIIAAKYLNPRFMDASYVYMSMVSNIHAMANEAGWEVTIDWADGDNDASLPDSVRRGNVDGAFLTGFIPDGLIARIAEQIPTVMISSATYWVDVPCFMSHSQKMITMAVRHLAGMGHKTIAYLNPFEYRESTMEHMRSLLYLKEQHEVFNRTVRRLGLCEDPQLSETLPLIQDSQLGNMVTRKLDTWLQRSQPVTAMIIPVAAATFVMQDLAMRSLRVPNDVSVLVIGDAALVENMRPPLTVINADYTTMVKSAMSVLMDGIAGKSIDVQTVLFEPIFINRQSTAPPRKSA